ncbi:hypothetical protein Hanom_Chr08g00697231 [Helianthus anomalus]
MTHNLLNRHYTAKHKSHHRLKAATLNPAAEVNQSSVQRILVRQMVPEPQHLGPVEPEL